MLKRSDSLFPRIHAVSFQLNPIAPLAPTPKKTFVTEIYYNPKLEEKLAAIEPTSSMDLSYWNLVDHDMTTIVKQVLTKKQYAELRLIGNHLTSQGLSILASKLSDNSILQSLDLSYNRIADAGVYVLAQALSSSPYSSLKVLSLNKNGISNSGIRYLTDMLQTNQTLTDLCLSYNEIGNEGVKQLANTLAHRNRTLKVLVLSFNIFITDASIECLLSMFEWNPVLERFAISDCNLSNSGKHELQEKVWRKKNLEIEV